MNDEVVALCDAKARLSELTERAAAGETIVIAKHGRAVARLSAVAVQRKRIDLEHLQKLTRSMPRQPQSAGRFLRVMCDQLRY